MYCTNCGKEINNDVKFCPFCGVKSEKDNTIEEYEEGKMMESVSFTDNSIKGGKKKSLFIRLSLVAVVGVLVVFVGFGFGKKTEVSKEANAVEGYVYVDGEGDLFYCKDFEKNESILLDHEVHAASNTLVYSLDGRGIYYLKEFDEITNVGKLFFAEFDRNGKKQKPILIDDAVKTDHLNAISEGVIYTKDEKDQVKLCYHNGNESVTIVRAQRSYMIHTMLCKETSMFYYIVYDEMLQNGDLFVFMPDEEEMKRKVTSNVDRLYSNKELLEQGIFVYAELYDETEEVYNETYYNREKLFAVKNGEKAELIAPYVQNVLATTWSEEKGLEIYYTYEDFLVTNKYDFFVIDDFETVDLEWLAWDGSNIFQENYLSKLDKNIEAYHRDLLRQDLKAAPFIVTDKTMCKYSGIDQSSEVVCENVKDFLLTFPDEEVFVYTQYLVELDERVDPYIDIISIESADDLTEETITYAVVLNMKKLMMRLINLLFM